MSDLDGADRNAEPKMLDVLGGGAFGVGLVLVLMPALAVFFGIDWLNRNKLVGLPILAIFGIVVLLGTLALVAMLFQRLGLAQKSEPLGLPPGSMRAAISLSLIVLFAIISIMLYLSISEKSEAFRIGNLTEAERNAMVASAAARVVNVVEGPCAASVPTGGQCATSDRRFDVHMRATPAPEATDLAKQLLILIGTLMTSVTSFYFATRGSSGEGAAERGGQGGQPGGEDGGVGDRTRASGGGKLAGSGTATASTSGTKTVGSAEKAATTGGSEISDRRADTQPGELPGSLGTSSPGASSATAGSGLTPEHDGRSDAAPAAASSSTSTSTPTSTSSSDDSLNAAEGSDLGATAPAAGPDPLTTPASDVTQKR